MRSVKAIIFMTWKTHKSPVRRGAALPALFVCPQLRGDNENTLKTCRQDVRFGCHVQVIINLVLPIEVRQTLRYGMSGIHEVNANIAFVPTRLFCSVPSPGPALHLPGPFILVSAVDRIMNDYEAAAALEELLKISSLISHDFHSVLRINDQHIRLIQ